MLSKTANASSCRFYLIRIMRYCLFICEVADGIIFLLTYVFLILSSAVYQLYLIVHDKVPPAPYTHLFPGSATAWMLNSASTSHCNFYTSFINNKFSFRVNCGMGDYYWYLMYESTQTKMVTFFSSFLWTCFKQCFCAERICQFN